MCYVCCRCLHCIFLLNWNGQRTRVFRSTRLSRLKIRGKTVKTLPYNLSQKESNPWLTCPERIHTLLEKAKTKIVFRHFRGITTSICVSLWRFCMANWWDGRHQVGIPRLCFEDYLKTTLIKELWNSYLASKRVFWCRAGQQRSHVSWRASQSPVKIKYKQHGKR